ncbi:MAG: RimK family alpha-L-glutamate ligase [Rubripirellula sp.]
MNRFLCLGAGEGWHADQLTAAAAALGCELHHAKYETLRASIREGVCSLDCEAGPLAEFDAILTRTMPAGTLEQITFRLATLHDLQMKAGKETVPIVNPPRSLEIAIDKFATLAHVAKLGYSVPETIVVQSRSEAVDAFSRLGGDCVIKPIFGGEGRGVMRVKDPELAWTAFCTLEQLGAVAYVQRFVPPGGTDTRLLVIGDKVIGLRRSADHDFRTNVRSGGRCQSIALDDAQVTMARRICDSIGLKFASVDLIDTEDGQGKVLEVNAIPGWKGAQSVTEHSIGEMIVGLLMKEAKA